MCRQTFTMASLFVSRCQHAASPRGAAGTGVRYSHIDFQTEDRSDWDRLSMGEDVYMCLLGQSRIHAPGPHAPPMSTHRSPSGQGSSLWVGQRLTKSAAH